MERLKSSDGAFPPVCFTCPARVYIGGEYYCDSRILDNPNIILNVAHYKPSGCTRVKTNIESSARPEIILRKMLGK